MLNKQLGKKVFALLLTFVMTLSMTGYTFVEAFAETEGTTVEETGSNENGEAAGNTGGENDLTGASGGTDLLTNNAETGNGDKPESTIPEKEPVQEPAQTPETVQDETPTTATAIELAQITVRASRDGKFVTAMWTKVENASYYMVYLNDETEGVKVPVSEKCKYIFNLDSLANNTDVQTVKVEAYREKAAEPAPAGEGTEGGENEGTNDPAPAEPQYEKFAEGIAQDIDSVIVRTLSGTPGVPANYMNQNLRTMIGEGNGGYAVAQGSATDGTYAYHVLASSVTQNGRIIKVNLSNPADYKAGPVINLHHANGMTYDSKRGLLVACGYGGYRHQLTYINPDTLQIESQPTLKYTYAKNFSGMATNAENNGIAAIAYVPKYDVYVARSRGKVDGVPNSTRSAVNNIWVFDAESLEAIGHIFTRITSDYPETYQSMDADERYVYFLLSPGDGQKKNIILALDWNSENLLPVVNGDAEYVDHMWYCNNNGTGRPDAVIQIPVGRESEGLFHTTDSNGNSHFYVTEYYGRNHYTTKVVTEHYKVKWKKVTKKVKWKRVKRKGKWKWKYKKKKVWKYKTKTRKVTKSVKDYWARDDYVYDLGVF